LGGWLGGLVGTPAEKQAFSVDQCKSLVGFKSFVPMEPILQQFDTKAKLLQNL